MEYKTASIEEIIADATAKGPEAIAFLKELGTRTETNKKGKTNRISFISIKRAYFEKYYPEQLPVAKNPKKKSIYELLENL